MTSRVRGVESVKSKLDRLPIALRNRLREEIARSAQNIENGAKVRVEIDEGDLRNSIRRRFRNDGMEATIGSNNFISIFVEFGRRRGRRPPVEPLIEWARRKGLANPEDAGWAIARHIETHGQEPRPFLWPAYADERRALRQRLPRVLKVELRKLARSR